MKKQIITTLLSLQKLHTKVSHKIFIPTVVEFIEDGGGGGC